MIDPAVIRVFADVRIDHLSISKTNRVYIDFPRTARTRAKAIALDRVPSLIVHIGACPSTNPTKALNMYTLSKMYLAHGCPTPNTADHEHADADADADAPTARSCSANDGPIDEEDRRAVVCDRVYVLSQVKTRPGQHGGLTNSETKILGVFRRLDAVEGALDAATRNYTTHNGRWDGDDRDRDRDRDDSIIFARQVPNGELLWTVESVSAPNGV
jgi:hypothetical protein